jgi:predicted ABC-type ATPase
MPEAGQIAEVALLTPPELFIVGGPNGCGKTTVVLEYLEGTRLPYLSADSIAAELNQERPLSAAVAAGRLLSRRLADAIKRGESVVMESTLSGLSLRKTMQNSARRGYRTTIFFVFPDSPEACLARIRERVARGGHTVPETDVTRRLARSLNNFWNVYRMMATEWVLYYNVYYNGGQMPARIASGRGEDLVVCRRDRTGEFFPPKRPARSIMSAVWLRSLMNAKRVSLPRKLRSTCFGSLKWTG